MKKGLWILWVLLGMGLCAMIFLVGLFWMGASSDNQTQPTTASSHASVSSSSVSSVSTTSSVASSSTAVTSPARETKDVKPLNHELVRTLDSMEGKKAIEDPKTIDNSEVTYSRFYQTDDQWYWELTSAKRGTIEKGRILSDQGKTDGMEWYLNMASVTQNGQHYTLKFVGANDLLYTVETNFQHLKGVYHFGDDGIDQKEKVLDQFTDTATEESSTRNNNEVTYSKFFKTDDGWHWRLWSNERGTIEEARVDYRTNDGYSTKLKMMSITAAPGQTYTLRLVDMDDGEYSVETSFQHIKGDYQIN